MTRTLFHDLKASLHALQINVEALRDEALPLTAERIALMRKELVRFSSLLGRFSLPAWREDRSSRLLTLNERELINSIQKSVLRLCGVLEAGFQKKHIALSLALFRDTQTTRPQTFYFSESMFERAFFNILNNALLYTPFGGTVEVYGAAEPSVFIAVKNSGSTISREEQELVFQQGYRGKAADISAEKGSGLGLFQAKEAMEHMGGIVKIKSRPSCGTTVTLLFYEVTKAKQKNHESREKGAT